MYTHRDLESRSQKMSADLEVDGPWGGEGGEEWYYIPKGPICGISITYGDVINTIRFTSQDEFCHCQHSPQFGNHEGSGKAEINIDPKVEKFNGVTGTFGSYTNLLVVISLSFTTDKGTCYGPFGKGNATGTAFSSKVPINDQIIGGFYGRSGSFLDAVGVYLQPTPKLIVGPWGGEGGEEWYYIPKGPICGISITYGDVINTICFTSQDEFDHFEHSPQFGNHEGSGKTEINIDPKVEKFNGITGTFGSYTNVLVVISLSFTTNKGTCYGPFGKGNETGTPFSSKIPINDQIIGGFFGRSGSFLHAIGVYLQPIPKLIVGPWGGEGGEEWYYIPKGPICGISITYGDVINTICFTSQDEFDHFQHSPQFGNHEGGGKAEINIDPRVEKFNGITGTFGSYTNLLVVTSLSFTTEKGTSYGPCGKRNATGTAFSSKSPINDQIISGFYGRSGSFLDAIGVYLQSVPKLSVDP